MLSHFLTMAESGDKERDWRERFPVELRLVIAVLAVAFCLSLDRAAGPGADRPYPFSSRVALDIAHALGETALGLPFDDPRLRATDGFVQPDGSLRSAKRMNPYAVRWQILDDVPARDMKRIEIRVTWPAGDEPAELSTIVIKVS